MPIRQKRDDGGEKVIGNLGDIKRLVLVRGP